MEINNKNGGEVPEEVREKVFERMMKQMTDEQLGEFEKLVENEEVSEAELDAFVSRAGIDLKKIVKEVLEEER